ncbi:MAG: hypothetical protein M3162_00015 [Thermoproteota archaeon]|nr:hypothetical protein [Thermoproteota archaeon]
MISATASSSLPSSQPTCKNSRSFEEGGQGTDTGERVIHDRIQGKRWDDTS